MFVQCMCIPDRWSMLRNISDAEPATWCLPPFPIDGPAGYMCWSLIFLLEPGVNRSFAHLPLCQSLPRITQHMSLSLSLTDTSIVPSHPDSSPSVLPRPPLFTLHRRRKASNSEYCVDSGSLQAQVGIPVLPRHCPIVRLARSKRAEPSSWLV